MRKASFGDTASTNKVLVLDEHTLHDHTVGSAEPDDITDALKEFPSNGNARVGFPQYPRKPVEVLDAVDKSFTSSVASYS